MTTDTWWQTFWQNWYDKATVRMKGQILSLVYNKSARVLTKKIKKSRHQKGEIISHNRTRN